MKSFVATNEKQVNRGIQKALFSESCSQQLTLTSGHQPQGHQNPCHFQMSILHRNRGLLCLVIIKRGFMKKQFQKWIIRFWKIQKYYAITIFVCYLCKRCSSPEIVCSAPPTDGDHGNVKFALTVMSEATFSFLKRKVVLFHPIHNRMWSCGLD